MSNKPNILIGGGTGLVGSRLATILQEKGYQTHILTRSPRGRENHFVWDVKNKNIDIKAFEGVKHIINLAGEGIASGLWTPQRKKRILDSRVNSNQLLIDKIERHNIKINSFVSASAVGIYGDQGAKWLTENDRGNPKDFLVDTCIQWEKTLNHPYLENTRKVKIRIGLVLAKNGGVLPKLLMTYKLGFGNYFGSGEQFYPWIHLDDISRIFAHSIEDDSVEGAYNGVAPNPHTNKDLVKGIGEILHKSTLIPIPKLALKIGLGEMSDVVLNSNRASAQKIINTGFEFKYPNLKPALRDLLKQ